VTTGQATSELGIKEKKHPQPRHNTVSRAILMGGHDQHKITRCARIANASLGDSTRVTTRLIKLQQLNVPEECDDQRDVRRLPMLSRPIFDEQLSRLLRQQYLRQSLTGSQLAWHTN